MEIGGCRTKAGHHRYGLRSMPDDKTRLIGQHKPEEIRTAKIAELALPVPPQTLQPATPTSPESPSIFTDPQAQLSPQAHLSPQTLQPAIPTSTVSPSLITDPQQTLQQYDSTSLQYPSLVTNPQQTLQQYDSTSLQYPTDASAYSSLQTLQQYDSTSLQYPTNASAYNDQTSMPPTSVATLRRQEEINELKRLEEALLDDSEHISESPETLNEWWKNCYPELAKIGDDSGYMS
ncbi:hypothetical protein ISN44_As10g018730 [Arabidopsis suecica]|uniref:Uncharacterized protein n=1 Tax=Arabidopsis suecica TaxID=45249 RepID=A0A8T1ZWA5_ARASU|nr:hypothetical protein ISN44_As10g018730 [Arabidopsis suecica]